MWVVTLLVGLGASYPFWGGYLAGQLVVSKLAKRLGMPVDYRSSRAGLGVLHIAELNVGPHGSRILSVAKAELPFSVAWGSGTIVFYKPKIQIRRNGKDDNISSLLDRLRKPSLRGSGTETASTYPGLQIKEGHLSFKDQSTGISMKIEKLDGIWEPRHRFQLTTTEIVGLWDGENESDPAFGAESVSVEGALSGMRPSSISEFSVKEGHLRPLATLPLTGITGTLKPSPDKKNIDLLFSGSYRGAKRTLWTATGKIKQPINVAQLDGELTLRAVRFSLDKISEVLPPSVLDPANTEIDVAMTMKLQGRKIAMNGTLDVDRLSFIHEKLSSGPVRDASFSMQFDAHLDRDRRRLDLSLLQGKIGALTVSLSGSLELTPGKFQFKNGRTLDFIPHIDLSLRVPRARCSKILASIPAPLVPSMQGFNLQGFFDADVRTRIDFDNLAGLELGGRVGINGCQVLKAPLDVLALMGPESIPQIVEVPPPPDGGSGTELMSFLIGPDNPDFVPYEKISPYLVSAILTTEDSGFFKHRGWVTPEFKTALKRNIAGGGFRLGASSITMQMVKNVLLSREKTLSRKLQELFLAWYVEQLIPKERILELYFNAIEYGPRLYGIGPAARHYFGKSAADLLPLEAAFFSSILPSPKRRYVQYCHGGLSPQWERYVRRIVSKMRERGRLNEEEFATAMASTLVFDKAEMTMKEKHCLEWVKKITALPDPDPDPEGTQ
jgi:hypothetical protein